MKRTPKTPADAGSVRQDVEMTCPRCRRDVTEATMYCPRCWTVLRPGGFMFWKEAA